MGDYESAGTRTRERARIRRHPGRSVSERAEVILRGGQVAHVGFVVDGPPVVIPFTCPRMGDLRGVELVAVRVEAHSAKMRSGLPLGKHDGDETAPGTSYVIELRAGGDA